MVTVVLPAQLRELVGGRGTIALDGGAGTLASTLLRLRERHPAVYRGICTEQGEIRPHVNVFVGREDVRWCGGLDAWVDEGSEVLVITSVSGG